MRLASEQIRPDGLGLAGNGRGRRRGDPSLETGETVILLRPPLPLQGDSIQMERGCQQSDSLADGYPSPIAAILDTSCMEARRPPNTTFWRISPIPMVYAYPRS